MTFLNDSNLEICYLRMSNWWGESNKDEMKASNKEQAKQVGDRDRKNNKQQKGQRRNKWDFDIISCLFERYMQHDICKRIMHCCTVFDSMYTFKLAYPIHTVWCQTITETCWLRESNSTNLQTSRINWSYTRLSFYLQFNQLNSTQSKQGHPTQIRHPMQQSCSVIQKWHTNTCRAAVYFALQLAWGFINFHAQSMMKQVCNKFWLHWQSRLLWVSL